METRANYLLVGLFTVGAMAGLLIFAGWMARPERESEPVPYDVVFEGQAMGIRSGSDVLFNGIKVGQVKDIVFDPENPHRVRVRITVERGTPMRVDVIAEIQPQGITGVSAVALSLGPGDAPALEPEPGEIPVIEGKPMAMAALKQDLPTVLANANELLERLSDVVNDKNREELAGILEDVHRFTGDVAGEGEAIDTLIANVNGLVVRADRLVADADTVVAEDVRDLVADIRKLVDTYDGLGDNVNQLIVDNRAPIDRFVGQGLGQVPPLVSEIRSLINDLESIVVQLEHDPSGFLLGGAEAQEYNTP